MASTKKLQSTVTWTRPLLKGQPLDISNMEPAVTFANMTLGTILAPPFAWPWNRQETTVQLIPGQCDYTVTLPAFGFLEDQWLQDPSGAVHPLNGALKLPLAPSNMNRQPTRLAAQMVGAGTIRLRTDARPDKPYTLGLTYQQTAPVLQSLGDTLAPLPDELGYLFEYGFLTLSSLLVSDARFPIYEKYFIGKLLAQQSGLDEQSVNIFMGNWQSLTKTIARTQSSVQLGTAGRNV